MLSWHPRPVTTHVFKAFSLVSLVKPAGPISHKSISCVPPVYRSFSPIKGQNVTTQTQTYQTFGQEG